MKTFNKDDIEYSVKQTLSDGIQYKARYDDGLEAWVFIPGKKHTRQQVIDAINEVNKQCAN